MVNSIDALKILRYSALLPYSQNEPCPNLGSGILQSGKPQGDVDCSNAATSIDALKILRSVAKLSYTQNEPCPNIGS